MVKRPGKILENPGKLHEFYCGKSVGIMITKICCLRNKTIWQKATSSQLFHDRIILFINHTRSFSMPRRPSCIDCKGPINTVQDGASHNRWQVSIRGKSGLLSFRKEWDWVPDLHDHESALVLGKSTSIDCYYYHGELRAPLREQSQTTQR